MKTSAFVATIEDLIEAVRANHPEIPEVTVLFAREAGLNGTWQRGAHELMISVTRSTHGALLVAQTVIHELVHALAESRGISETSGSGNRYHNKHFAELATEMGLTPPEQRDRTRGYSACTLSELTAKRYEAQIAAIAKVLDASDKAVPVSQTVARKLVFGQCACRTIPGRSLQSGGLTCEKCGESVAKVAIERQVKLVGWTRVPPSTAAEVEVEEPDFTVADTIIEQMMGEGALRMFAKSVERLENGIRMVALEPDEGLGLDGVRIVYDESSDLYTVQHLDGEAVEKEYRHVFGEDLWNFTRFRF